MTKAIFISFTATWLICALALTGDAQSVVEQNGRSGKTVTYHDDYGSRLLDMRYGVYGVNQQFFSFGWEIFVSGTVSGGMNAFYGFERFTKLNAAYRRTRIDLMIPVNYHLHDLLNLTYRWDIYLGGAPGFSIPMTRPADYNNDPYTPDDQIQFAIQAQAGIRYYLTPWLGLNLEGFAGNIRYGAGAGITFKF